MPDLPDVIQARPRRDLVMLAVGALFGLAVGAGLGMVLADDDGGGDASPTRDAVADDQGDGDAGATGATEAAVDPTNTDFGQLTDAASEAGVKVQWKAEILEGPETGEVEFVAAHRDGTTVLVSGDTRVIDDGQTIRVCNGSCQTSDAAGARDALPELVRPYWDIIRSVEETTGAPDYRITGETQLASGIFQRCGQIANPQQFGIEVPDNVATINQCVDAQRTVPVTIGLNGEQRSVGGAQLTAIADAQPDLFRT